MIADPNTNMTLETNEVKEKEKEEEESIKEMEEVDEDRDLKNGNNYYFNDSGGFFSFQDRKDWSKYSLLPSACISSGKEDYVVFNMYKANNSQCTKHKMGMYKIDVKSFIIGYVRQKNKNGYNLNENVLSFLDCQQVYINNQIAYVKLGCRDGNSKTFQLHTYTDSKCKKQSGSSYYNSNLELSSLGVGFGVCNNCDGSSYAYSYNNYNKNNKYNNNKYINNKYYSDSYNKYPLCSAAFHYKKSCGWKCKGSAKKAAKSSGNRNSNGGSSSGSNYNSGSYSSSSYNSKSSYNSGSYNSKSSYNSGSYNSKSSYNYSGSSYNSKSSYNSGSSYNSKSGYNYSGSSYNSKSGYNSGRSYRRNRSYNSFSPIEVVMLWIFCLSAIFFLMKGLSQRKKLSKTERNLEEARIKATGLRLKWLPRVFVVLIFVLVILIFSERKIASWILLGALNFISLGYWINTSRRTESSDDYHEFQEA